MGHKRSLNTDVIKRHKWGFKAQRKIAGVKARPPKRVRIK
jgi:hypothetical protein